MAKKQTGIRRRFMSMLFGATAVFLLIIFVIVNISVLQSQLQKREKDAETRVAYIANAINDELNSALDVSNNITQNELITDILAEGPGDSMEHVMEAYSFIRKHFSAFTQYGRNMNRQIRIYPVDTKFPGGKYIYRLDTLRESPVWEDMEAMKPYESVWNFADIDNTPTVSLYRKINSTDELLGYLEIQIPFYWIKNILTKTELTSGERLEYKNSRGEILYESSAKNRGKALDFVGELANRDVVTLSIDRSTLIGENIIFILTSALVFIVLLFAIWFLSRYFVYSLTDELNSFISELNRDEEALLSLSLTEEDKGGSELYEIKKKFIMLIGRVSDMHNDIEKINLEKKKIEMEYLQMSFNPHLLYNSLSTLNWILRKSNRPDMVELVDHMTEYYRSVLSGGDNIITVRKEIELIRRYLDIVRISYNRPIELTVDCDEELMDYYIIKQLLQPVVENAVLHGAKGMKCSEININVSKDDGDLVFVITNNGKPITEEEIQKALNEGVKSPGRRSYGLKNTVNRIKTYYGEQYGISIRGIEGVGTEVTVRIEQLADDNLKERM